MGHGPRWYLPELVYEVTIRPLDGTFWLRPDPLSAAIVAGVFGRALQRYPGVRLHGYDAQSNHMHHLLSASEPAQLPRFIGFVHSNVARQINDLRRRRGVFWSRRSKVIAVLDPDAQLDRMTYLLSQGPKDKLVASPRDWPGACSTPALLGDMTQPARYKSLDACRRNRRRKNSWLYGTDNIDAFEVPFGRARRVPPALTRQPRPPPPSPPDPPSTTGPAGPQRFRPDRRAADAL